MNVYREKQLLSLVEAALAQPAEQRLDWLRARCSPTELSAACRVLHRADILAEGDECRLLTLVAAAARRPE